MLSTDFYGYSKSNVKMLSLLLLPLCGCAGIIHELKAPNTGYGLIHHSRGVGFRVHVPNQAGGSMAEMWFGWLSETTELIPYCTNAQGNVSTAAINDDFHLDNSLSLSPSTKITESLTTGWTGSPPPPRFPRLFDPTVKLKPASTNAP